MEERRGARTLFLEANNHKDIGCIRSELLSADYESLGEKKLEDLRLEAYDYVVADLGTDLGSDFGAWRAGLSDAAIGILIGNGAPWKRERFCQAARGIRNTSPSLEWVGLLSLGEKKEALRLSGQLELFVGALGWQPLYEPLSMGGEELFLSLLQGGKKMEERRK